MPAYRPEQSNIRVAGETHEVSLNCPFVTRHESLQERQLFVKQVFEADPDIQVLNRNDVVWFSRAIAFAPFTEEVIERLFKPRFPYENLDEDRIALFFVFDDQIVLAQMVGATSECQEMVFPLDNDGVLEGAIRVSSKAGNERRILVVVSGSNEAPTRLREAVADKEAIARLEDPSELTFFNAKLPPRELLRARMFTPAHWQQVKRYSVLSTAALVLLITSITAWLLLQPEDMSMYELPPVTTAPNDPYMTTNQATVAVEQTTLTEEQQWSSWISSSRWDTVAFAELTESESLRYSGVEALHWSRDEQGVVKITLTLQPGGNPNQWIPPLLNAWDLRQPDMPTRPQHLMSGAQGDIDLEGLAAQVSDLNDNMRRYYRQIMDSDTTTVAAAPIEPVGYSHHSVGGYDHRVPTGDAIDFGALCRQRGGEVMLQQMVEATEPNAKPFTRCTLPELRPARWQRQTDRLPPGRLSEANCTLPNNRYEDPTECQLTYQL